MDNIHIINYIICIRSYLNHFMKNVNNTNKEYIIIFLKSIIDDTKQLCKYYNIPEEKIF